MSIMYWESKCTHPMQAPPKKNNEQLIKGLLAIIVP